MGRMLNAHLNRSMDANYDVPMQGPEALKTNEAAERYAKVTGLKVSRAPFLLVRTIGLLTGNWVTSHQLPKR